MRTEAMRNGTLVAGIVSAVALVALPGAATAAVSGNGRIDAEASGGGMTVHGSDAAEQIQVGYDPARPGLILVSDPLPPYAELKAVGESCVEGTHPALGTPELRCTLSEPLREGAQISVVPNGGRNKVWIGLLPGGRPDPTAAFPYRARGNGGPGDDRIFVAGQGSHVGGGFGDDVLLGGSGDNILTGAPGNDRLIDRFGGDDILHGGKGGDVLEGGPGRDLLTGWEGRDVLLGGGGGDRLYSRDGQRDRKTARNGGQRDKRIECGGGAKDEARVERVDPKARGCERVRRIGRDLAVGEVIDFP